ncbi:MAG: shikimate dehydrogenase [Clostridia bacterium]|nr:shikimate dehydrogenase [Clostridia bacterium]
MKEITAKTKLAGILGNPVSHSLSPRLHGYLAEKAGFDMAYLAFQIEEAGQLGSVLAGAKHMGFLGFNVTAPYKIDVLSFIDEIDEDAKQLGNVNTLVNRAGKWIGSNTDGIGFMRSLKRKGVSAEGKHILLFGTGGTARTLSYKFAQGGAASITIVSRKENPLEEIGQLTKNFAGTELKTGLDVSCQYDICVNCTPLGMGAHKDKSPIPANFPYHKNMLCCDLIYNPTKTLYLEEAERAGAMTMNGLGMLLYQGVYAFERFTGETVSEEICDGLFRHFESDNK